MANIVVISLDDPVDSSVSTINSNFAALNTALGSHTHAPSDLTSGGAAWGQILTWNGSAWAPSSVMVVGSGMVGIGTSNPVGKLTVVPDHDGYAAIQLLSPSNNAKQFGVWVESATNSCTLGYWVGSQFGNVYLQGTVLCPYRVGIGTDTPTAKLTVVPDGDGQPGIQVLCPSNRNKYLTIIPESSSGTCILGYWAGSAWGNVYLGGSMWSDSQIGAAQFRCSGNLILDGIPTSNPGAGTKKVWADPADGYRLKLAY